MKHRSIALRFLLAAALVGLVSDVSGAQEIQIRLSIKYVLDAQGNRAPGPWSTDAAVLAVIEQTSAALERGGRGYGYQVLLNQQGKLDEVVGQSSFFNIETSSEYAQLEAAAEQNPVAFYWRQDAVNVYIVNSAPSGGAAAIPSNPPDFGLEFVVITAGAAPDELWPHELGHHYDLYHTFDQDFVADTLFDPESTCIELFSCQTGGNAECCCTTKIALLDAMGYSQEDRDNLLYNTMSYYGALDCAGLFSPAYGFDTIRLTDGQLDRFTDATRLYHPGEASGFTYFVDGVAPTWPYDGFSFSPAATVTAGIGLASPTGGDIVLVRTGVYAETGVFTKPVTLRASRGTVVIGT